MDNRVRDFFNWLSASCTDIMRAIVVVFGAVMAVSTTWNLWNSYKFKTDTPDYPDERFLNYHFFIMRVCLSVVYIVGVYLAYLKNSKPLKMFAPLIFAFAIMYFCLAATEVSLDNWSGRHESFLKLMTRYAQEYNWRPFDHLRPNEGTRAWDLLQVVLDCCGLNGPSDWTDGPLHSGGGNLPESCCKNYLKCTTKSTDVYKEGCLQHIDTILINRFMDVYFSCIILVLFGISTLLLARKISQKPNFVLHCAQPSTVTIQSSALKLDYSVQMVPGRSINLSTLYKQQARPASK